MEARTRLRNKAPTHRLPQAERMGSMPLHNLTHREIGHLPQHRRVASYPSADEAGYGSVHTHAKQGSYPSPATGRADGICAAAQSYAREIGHLPK